MNRRLPSLIASITLTVAFAGTCQPRASARSLETIGAPASIGRPSTTLREWEFDTERDLHLWRPNAHLNDVTITNGVLHGRATDWDPFLLCRDVSIEAKPSQYIVVRMSAGQAGIGELFWSGQIEGRYGGLTEEKKLRFSVAGGNRWQEIVLFPFWHTERVIRQLRLDLYEGSDFEIDWIRVEERGQNSPPSGINVWSLGGDTSTWQAFLPGMVVSSP